MQKEGTSALFPAARAALQAEDVLAHIQGGLDDVSMDELAENAALADEHAELLTAHGYRLVWDCPLLTQPRIVEALHANDCCSCYPVLAITCLYSAALELITTF